jgi:ATP-binding cassette subfamily A (ABC1) protein 3
MLRQAGKTTTISMLTGMVSPSRGDATVYGTSILDDMKSVRKDIGFCPQHDVLYPQLTVLQHLVMFGQLKGIQEEMEMVAQECIANVGLTEKVHTYSGNLSGGQKRKLSLSMALIGDSRAIFLDEPTSGMDPYSRRSTWNMLQSARSGRVIILTTHFMDEADILGDRIGIMSHGELRCCGSSLYLKSMYGGGYNLSIAMSKTGNSAALKELVSTLVPSSEVLSDVGTELKFQLPMTDMSSFPRLLAKLESQQRALGFDSYGIGITTMEEVFLRVAADQRTDDEDDSAMDAGTSHVATSVDSVSAELSHQSDLDNDTAAVGVQTSKMDAACLSRRNGFSRHLAALFIKRVQYGTRDRKAQCCNTITPAALLWFGLWLMYDVFETNFWRDAPGARA